jgi:cytochrome c553
MAWSKSMSMARHRVFAWLLVLALALLPLHGVAAKALTQPAVAADMGDCHGQKAPDGDAAQCANCSACHAVQAEPAQVLPEQGHAAVPTATLPPTLHGRVLQPDLHPPLT